MNDQLAAFEYGDDGKAKKMATAADGGKPERKSTRKRNSIDKGGSGKKKQGGGAIDLDNLSYLDDKEPGQANAQVPEKGSLTVVNKRPSLVD